MDEKRQVEEPNEAGSRSQSVQAEGGGTISQVTQVAGDYVVQHYYGKAGRETAVSHLPPKAYHALIGRTEEQNDLMGLLRVSEGKRLLVIVGLGGMGKTALARELVARSQAEGLFEHLVWTSAKTEHFVGERRVAQGEVAYNFESLLNDIGRQCGRIDITALPITQKEAAVAHLLKQQRVLVVMDNLETVADSDGLVQQMVAILGQSVLLITSRHRVDHDLVFTLNLRGLPDEEGVAFLKAEGRERNIEAVAAASFRALLEIQERTGGAPLAMKLVVGQLSRLPLTAVLQTLQQASAKGQDYDFYRFVYWHSWGLLDDNGRVGLVDMSVFPPMSGGAVADVAAVSQLADAAFWSAMDQLVTMSLVDKIGVIGQERYALHALTHYFILADITQEWVGDEDETTSG